MLLFPLILGLMPEFSEANGERGWGPYHSGFRLSHNPAVFTMATHLCYSTLLGSRSEVMRFYSTEWNPHLCQDGQEYLLCKRASHCSYKIGQNHSTIYLFNFLFIYLFIFSLTDPLSFIWWYFPSPEVCNFRLTYTRIRWRSTVPFTSQT